MLSALKRAVKNPYTFSLISKFFGVLVGFLFTIFQARFLGAEIKGQVATVNSIVSVTAIVFALGIYQAYPYYKRNSNEDILPIFMKIAVFLLAIYGVAAAAIILLVDLSIKYIAVMILTPLLVYDGIVSYITLVEEPNKRNATDMLVMLGELILVVVLWLVSEPSFLIGVFVITIKDITKACIFTFWWRKRIFVRSESIWKWLPKLIRFGFFPMLSLLMATLNYRVDVIMLNGQVPDSAIGIYSVGVAVAERVWMIPDAMKGIMVSHLAKGKDANETALVIRLCNTGCLGLVLAIAAVGQPFITWVFSAEYQGAYQITLILLLGVFSMIYYKAIANYNIAMGRQVVSFVLLTVSVICNIVANCLLIPVWGIYGAGVASVISYALCGLLFMVFFRRTTHIPYSELLFIKRADIEKARKLLGRSKANMGG